MFKIIDMSPSSKFWWVIYALVVIGLMVFVHPITLLFTIGLTVMLLPFNAYCIIGEFFTRIFVNPVKSFNCWLDSKFRK